MVKNLSKIIAVLIVSLLFPINTLADNYCGDGVQNEDMGEECDDGNFINRDGCSSYCILEDMDPPEISSVSIAQDATDIPTTTTKFTVTFSEPVDPATINNNTIKLKQSIYELDTDLTLDSGGTNLTIDSNEDLFGELRHSIIITNVKDIPGNKMPELFVRSFYTGEFIDHTPPYIKMKPEGGEHHVAQSVTFSAYIDSSIIGEDYIDKSAIIYYTLDGSYPSTDSAKYETSISIKDNTVLKYLGIDGEGNRTDVVTEIYEFSCGERLNAKSVTPYPECKIEECVYGNDLKNNVCVTHMGEIDDYKANAATAPLFGSDTPMIISTKPALYITPEHNGLIPRPIIFKDLERGTIIEFERNTKITKKDGSDFSGYIKPPSSLYMKNYPIHFGYTFKSIFEFKPYSEDELFFDPPYKISIPFSDNFNIGEPVTIFTFAPETEQYTVYDTNMITINDTDEMVTIIADKTNAFFIAQEGKNFNRIVFTDTVGHWAHSYIEMLYRMDIVKGRDLGIFAPDDILTRAEFIKIALKSIGEEIDLYKEVEKAPFNDVPLYAWYVPYIKRAKEIGLVHGYPDGTFKPDQPIIKVEAIKILMTAFEFDLEDVGERTDSFRDVDTSQWYYQSVHFAIENGLADGRRLSSGTIVDYAFDPASNMTRAEMAKLAVKTIELDEELQNN